MLELANEIRENPERTAQQIQMKLYTEGFDYPLKDVENELAKVHKELYPNDLL